MKRRLSIVLVMVIVAIGLCCATEGCKFTTGNVVAGWFTVEIGITGDINMDGKVDLVDQAMLGQAWGAHSGQPNFNDCADLNGDGVVDLVDLGTLGQQWSKSGFYTKEYPPAPGYYNPSPPTGTAWLYGIWYVDPPTGLVTVDCKEVGVGYSDQFFPNCNQVQVVSPGDVINSCKVYKHEPRAKITAHITSTSVLWESRMTFLQLPTYESWLLMVRDNGDHHVKLKLLSVVGGYPGENVLAVQEVNIRW